MMSGLRTGMQPIPMTALIFVLLIVGPGLAWAGKSPLKSEEPHTAMAINEVQALVPEPDLVIRPSFSGDDIFHLDGTVVWDTAQAPIGVLKVNVELWIIGLGLYSNCEPGVITLERYSPSADFKVWIHVPQRERANAWSDATLEGAWYYSGTSNRANSMEPIPISVTLESYSNVILRDYGQGQLVQMRKGEWTDAALTLFNEGNDDDMVSIDVSSVPSGFSVKRSSSPVPLAYNGMARYVFKLKQDKGPPGEYNIIIRVSTEHYSIAANDTFQIGIVTKEYVTVISEIAGEYWWAGSILMVLLIALIFSFLARRIRRSRNRSGSSSL